ncbi:MAG: outer membrane beta-barrel protein [bacterium]
MRNKIVGTIGFFSLLVAGQASAIGLGYGVRLGVGPGFGDKALSDVNINTFSVGGALKFDLALLGIEANLLYTQVTSDFSGTDAVSTDLDLPVIAQVGFPLIPVLLDLKLGVGLQPRFHLGATFDGKDVENDQTEDMVMYLPIQVGASLGLGVASVGLDIRYLYQLTDAVKDDDTRVNHLLFMAGVFF